MTRIGRPPVEDPRNNLMKLRLNDAEDALLEEASRVLGEPKTTLLRTRGLAALRREIRRAKRAES